MGDIIKSPGGRDIEWFGGGNFFAGLESVDNTIEFDKHAIAKASMTYSCLWTNSVAFVNQLKRHPEFPYLLRTSATITREEAMHAKIVVNFEGVVPGNDGTNSSGQSSSGTGSSGSSSSSSGSKSGSTTSSNVKYNNESPAVYTLEGDLMSQPLESHPNFAAFAGDVKHPKPGANFIRKPGPDYGKFTGFVSGPKAGMKTYLAPSLVYTETITRSGEWLAKGGTVDATGVGKLGNPPKSSFMPSGMGSGSKWLLASVSVNQIGEGVQVVRKWRAVPGQTPDKDIYG